MAFKLRIETEETALPGGGKASSVRLRTWGRGHMDERAHWGDLEGRESCTMGGASMFNAERMRGKVRATRLKRHFQWKPLGCLTWNCGAEAST